MSPFDTTAMGSDVARDRGMLWRRRASSALIRLLRLDRPTPFATEFCQSLDPVARVDTPAGPLLCRAGHGRLVWRAESFYEEEPQTIDWLDALGEQDVLWDVGANVGMYAVYAAKFRGCRVIAFEPEAQNHALLIDNIAMNDVGDRCFPACVALASHVGFGELGVRYVTKGGAYNQFRSDELDDSEEPYVPAAIENGGEPAARQLLYGATIDGLTADPHFPFPTHLKLDVDGLEPDILEGAGRTLADRRLRGILVEVNRASARHRTIPPLLETHGFALVQERSNWEYRADRSREHEVPDVNMIFERGGG